MKRMVSALVSVTAVAGVITLAVFFLEDGGTTHPVRSPGIRVGSVAPRFSVTGQREVVTQRLFAGRNILMAFVTPNCPDCASVLRNLATLAPKLVGPGGLRTYYVVIDRGTPSTDRISRFADTVGAGVGPYLTTDPSGADWRAYRVTAASTVVIVGANGRVVWRATDPPLAELRVHIHQVASLVPSLNAD